MRNWNIVLWNAHSFISPYKHAQLIHLPDHITFVAITETHMDTNAKHPHIPNFPYMIHRPHSAYSNGVALYSRQPITICNAIHGNCPNTLYAETMGPDGRSIIIGVIYSNHNGKNGSGFPIDDTIDTVRNAINTNKDIIVLGDWNCHSTDWEPTINNSDTHGDQLAQFIRHHGLTILNNQYSGSRHISTYRRGVGAKVIDLAITNCPQLFVNCITNDTSIDLVSDHHPVTVIGRVDNNNDHPTAHQRNTRPRWNMEDADWILYRTLLTDDNVAVRNAIDIIDTTNNDTRADKTSGMSTIWRTITDLLTDVVHQCVPQQSSTTNTYQNSWFGRVRHTKHLLVSYRAATQRWYRYRNDLDHQRVAYDKDTWHSLHDDMCNARSKWSSTIANAKKDDWYHRCDKINKMQHGRNNRSPRSSAFNWAAFNATKSTATRANLRSIVTQDGQLPANDVIAVNNYASHIANTCSISKDLHYDVDHHDYITRRVKATAKQHCNDADIGYTMDEVKSVFDISNPQSAMGPDCIHANFLRYATPDLIYMFTIAFNYSWRNSVLPIDWKIADVCVLHKTGAPVDTASSYRPISLTSIAVKAFERLVLKRLTGMINKDAIDKTQSGFRRNHCTLDNLYHLWSNIQQHHTTQKDPFYAAFIDYRAAFDSVWHDGLMYKLARAGVTGRAWLWIRSYLTDRRIRVVSNGVMSDWHHISAGVPQGAVLSPFLFIIDINDLTHSSKSETIDLKYADDVVVWNKEHTRDGIVRSLNDIIHWSYKWKLQINGGKSGIVRFTSHHKTYKHIHNNVKPVTIKLSQFHWYKPHRNGTSPPTVTFNFVQQYKYLGIIFASDGSWTQHSNAIAEKAAIAANMVQRIIHRNRLPGVVTIRTLIRTTVLPIITYGWPVWRPTATMIKRYHSIIIRPLRTVLGLPRTAPTLPLMVELAIPAITHMYHQYTIRFFNRLNTIPANHLNKSLFSLVKWNWKRVNKSGNDYTVVDVYQRGAPLIKRIAAAIKHLVVMPDKYSDVTYNNWSTCKHGWTNDKTVHLLALQASRRDWIVSGTAKHLQQLWTHVPDDKPYMPLYLSVDSRDIAAVRCRTRMDRTTVKQAIARHSDCTDSTICDRCDMNAVQDIHHYLYHCTNADIVKARSDAKYMHQHIIQSVDYKATRPDGHMTNDTIIVFTDGSSHGDGCTGAAAVASVPTSNTNPHHNAQRIWWRTNGAHNIYMPQGTNTVSHPHVHIATSRPSALTYHFDDTHHAHIYAHILPIIHGTNNIGELYAIALAINAVTDIINTHTHTINHDIVIVTDSQYCIGVICHDHTSTQHPHLIQDIRQRVIILMNRGTRRVYFTWARGHHGYAGNETADHYAGIASNAAYSPSARYHTLTPMPNYVPVANDSPQYSYDIPHYNDICAVQQPNFTNAHMTCVLKHTARFLSHIYAAHPI
jgi:ribonuclease HI